MSLASEENRRRDIAHVIHPFTDLGSYPETGPTTMTEGKGIYVYDDRGREIIEGVAGLWCASMGFSDPALIEAAVEQMRKLAFYHSFGRRSTPSMIELASRLSALAPGAMSKVMFANSGSEANDTAIKLVWYYNNALGRPAKKKIISRERSYHGVTVATGSLTGAPHIHARFDLPLPGFLHTMCPDFYGSGLPGETEEEFSTRLANALDALILAEGPETVAAFVADPIMCAAGVLTPPRGYFEKVQAVLRRHDVLFIVDEVISGFGRTGEMFASDYYGLTPDILTCAKALTSAYFPMSAVLVADRLWEPLAASSKSAGGFWHGFTSGGHPVGAAIALKTLDLLDERVMDHARAMIPVFKSALAAFADDPMVGAVRSVGLMGAVQLRCGPEERWAQSNPGGIAETCARHAYERGLIVIPRGGAICFCPPLIITADEIGEMFRRFALALEDTRRAFAGRLASAGA